MWSTPDDKWKPIKKDLLTPCRRPGLSRIVKTPLHGSENRESPVGYHLTSTPPQPINSATKNDDKPTKQKATSSFKPKESNADSVQKNHDIPQTTAVDNHSHNSALSEIKSPIVKILRYTPPNTPGVKVKKRNRLSIKRSMSPDDLCDTLENEPPNSCDLEDDETKIDEIQKRIKLKEAQLDDLKRAAIYAKLHNVQELDELTLEWKQGCNKALQYLLEKLQEHCHIEMPTLLRRLNISESVIESNVCNKFI